MTLRTVHLVFILLAIMGADLFGAWAVWNYTHTKDPVILGLGIAVVIGGFGLILYAFRIVRRLDEANVH